MKVLSPKCRWNSSRFSVVGLFVLVVPMVLRRANAFHAPQRSAAEVGLPLALVCSGSSSSGITRGARRARQQQFLSSSLSDNLDSDDKKVGDYVQGVHGGKYQFEEFGGATYEGRQFAESLYSSSSSSSTTTTANKVPDGPVPSWAQKMGTTNSRLGIRQPLFPPKATVDNSNGSSSPAMPVLSISSSSTTSITITNDERSWEYYYCKLVEVSSTYGTILDDTAIWCHETTENNDKDNNDVQQSSSSSCCPILVTPSVGQLAPRGGSSNLCDPSKPYSDSVTIHIQQNVSHNKKTNNNNNLLFVIGTEAETWPYWIQLD